MSGARDKSRPTRVLIGYMNEVEGVNFLRRTCLFEGTDDEKLREIWSEARSAVDALPGPDLLPDIIDFNEEFDSQLDLVANNPLLSQVALGRPWALKLVEIDKLVCFQKSVSTDYSLELARDYDFTKMKNLIDFCLPVNQSRRLVGQSYDEVQNVHTLFSSNSDLRILGSVQGENPGTKQRFFGFAVGWGIPFVSVVHFGNRYILKNGYHRLFALRERGIIHTPCVLIEGKTYSDTGGAKPGFFSRDLVLSPKPPTFGNFLSEKIAPTVQVRETTKVIRIRAEEFVLPLTARVSTHEEGDTMPSTPVGPAKPAGQERWDFSIENEDWNTYALQDGSFIKLRQLLLRVGKPEVGGPDSGVQMKTSNVLMSVSAPPELRGEPSEQQFSPDELSSSVVETNLAFDVVHDVKNAYILPNGTKLTLQLLSPSFSRTSKFDADGEPTYLVNVQTGVHLEGPESVGGN